MSPVIAGEGWFIIHSFLMGIIITFVYDWFRIFRRIVPHGVFLVSLEDLLFWVGAAAGIFYMFYFENNGMFRWFAIIGAALGMFLYKKTLSRPFVNLLSGIVKEILAIIGKMLRILTAPFRFVSHKVSLFLRRQAKRAAVEARIRRRRWKLRLTSVKKMIKMKLCKRSGKDRGKHSEAEKKKHSCI